MPFERPTIQEITDRIEKGIESRLFGKTALLRRAILRVLARVFAGAIHTCYGFILAVVKQLFITTATGSWLDRHGLIWGIKRKSGSFASGSADFTATIGTVLPEDTRIQNEDGIEYGTTVQTTFSSTTETIPIQAVEAGEDGNIEVSGTYTLQMVSTYPGVESEVILNADLTGGQDQEEDEGYRKRILQRIQEPPMGGNKEDYISWATDVEGVDQAWSYPLAFGPGTVAVIITAVGNNPVASSVLLGDTKAYIDELKPVGATTYVQTVEDSSGSSGTAKIDYDISINPNTTDLQNIIKENIRDLFYPLKPGTDILISQVRGAIDASGVTDYEITDFQVDNVSKSIDDYSLPGFSYPELDIINFTTKV